MTDPAKPDASHPSYIRATMDTRAPRRSFALSLGVTALTLGLGLAWPRAAEMASAPVVGPLQLMADVTLIDARCRGLAADFGALFRYGEANGIPAVAVLPLGRLRKAFDAAYARRAATTSAEDLCTAVAEEDAEVAPGVIRHP